MSKSMTIDIARCVECDCPLVETGFAMCLCDCHLEEFVDEIQKPESKAFKEFEKTSTQVRSLGVVADGNAVVSNPTVRDIEFDKLRAIFTKHRGEYQSIREWEHMVSRDLIDWKENG